MKVLEHTRVLDLSPYLPTQYCSLQLAQLGAEVILIERPGEILQQLGYPERVIFSLESKTVKAS